MPHLICRYIFHARVERFLQRSPKRHGLSVTLRAVEMAGPWKVVALLRLGPFPYHWLNYVLVRTLLLLLLCCVFNKLLQ
jgi:uncharacterized membrane protein YdjX (TVP38/TMEM64 family)